MSDNAGHGIRSVAGSTWERTQSEIRAFHKFGLLWAESGYDKVWAAAIQRVDENFDPDDHHGDEHVWRFDEQVEGMWPDRFGWMIHAAAIKDAVTAFEVYMEDVLREWLSHIRIGDGSVRPVVRVTKGRESPNWLVLTRFHADLGANISTPSVREIRDLRHLLTHQRGELRSEAAIEKFTRTNAGDRFSRPRVGDPVELHTEDVLKVLADLDETVRATEHAIFERVGLLDSEIEAWETNGYITVEPRT
ncbi:hypothetical protein MSTE_03610 [Mycobacteroides stephanolepidis]|uniref:Uncharacterized protein n=1 Tax=[Mycobacterium] stephanolepidis TaxID=1520670 RepID=A0A1Z4F128_9MYCO|nr:hypothetical protein [[Mycobacterium] stephanolepidis]BAX98910.1 hypothetical protein MSTE_03610 [[Mycobacterium] stephanolepidis]